MNRRERALQTAKLAYTLATVYSGQPTGPGRLPITGVAPGSAAADIVQALVREACVGETIAAAEALALSTLVVDPAQRSVFARISEDEARHAELGCGQALLVREACYVRRPWLPFVTRTLSRWRAPPSTS